MYKVVMIECIPSGRRRSKEQMPSNYVEDVELRENASSKYLCIFVALADPREELIENFYQLLRFLWAFYLCAVCLNAPALQPAPVLPPARTHSRPACHRRIYGNYVRALGGWLHAPRAGLGHGHVVTVSALGLGVEFPLSVYSL